MFAKSNPKKVSFQLTKHGREIEIRSEASGGEATSVTTLPTGSMVDELVNPNPKEISPDFLNRIGDAFYKILFFGEVGALAFDSLQDSIRKNKSVHFELRFDADQISLTKYPWEMIKNEHGQFLVRDGLVDMTRYITYPQPPPAFGIDLKNSQLLRLISQPAQLPLITAVDLKIKNIETIKNATFKKFQQKLLIENFPSWGVQFDGHGAVVLECQSCRKIYRFDTGLKLTKCRCGVKLSNAKQIGVLAFEQNGETDLISAEEFGSVIYNTGIQLALLLACESSKIGNRVVFNALSPNLILAGVPAVIGMQFPVLDSFANDFANYFYIEFFKTKDVIKSVRSARRINLRRTWYCPTLYLRHNPHQDEDDKPTYKTRNIDTAVPSKVLAGDYFLVRLWVRRPETKPATDKQLRKDLDISETVDIGKKTYEADVKFELVEDRTFRRGKLIVKLESPECEIIKDSIELFVDDHRDAPPAIFILKPKTVGKIHLIFNILQNQNLIATVTHFIESVERFEEREISIQKNSSSISSKEGKMLKQGGGAPVKDGSGTTRRKSKKRVPIGKKIKKARMSKKFNLDRVANETGFSTEYLKEVESGKSIPPVGALLQIARALEIDSGFLLKESESKLQSRIKAHTKRTDNYAYMTLTPGTENKHLKAFHVFIESQQDDKGVDYQHEGEEFVYVLSGKIEVAVGEHINKLGQGESLHFNSGIRHKLRNISDDSAELLVVIYSP